jgi:hypothetical protein
LTIEGPAATEVDAAKLQPILDRYEMAVTGHTDPCLSYACPIQGVRAACLNELERCTGIFADLGAEIMNIHPSYFCPSAMRNSIVNLNIEALKPIAYDNTITLEVFCDDAAMLFKYLDLSCRLVCVVCVICGLKKAVKEVHSLTALY